MNTAGIKEPTSGSSTWAPLALQQAFQTSMTADPKTKIRYGKAVPKSMLMIDFV